MKHLRVAGVLLATLGLAACSEQTDATGEASPTAAVESSAAASPTAPGKSFEKAVGSGKQWTVDTSGWWVPDDPTGCDLTVVCDMNAWPTRGYEQRSKIAIVRHGDKVTVLCQAPSPAAIRNDLAIDSKNWVYAKAGDQYYWFADIHLTRDDLDGLVKGVPECPSNTPGIDG